MSRAVNPEQPLPDARPTNWVDRSAPEALKPWLKLGRFDRPIGIWLLMLPGWRGFALAFPARCDFDAWCRPLLLLVLCAGGATLMRAAGRAFNAVVDRATDVRVARTSYRPVASGRISVETAFW